jgi:beta-lactamase regulating signal transducer with metallopeptidase domain
MVFALPRATLLWPAELDQRLDLAGMRAVLLHELAHLKRRDQLTAWLEIAAACLWWWHPVVWWARHELREYAEFACDAWVVAQLPGERGGMQRLWSMFASSFPWQSPRPRRPSAWRVAIAARSKGDCT